jgi:signal transduction histidine kinase
MVRLDDLLEDLRLRQGQPFRETFYSLLRRGRQAAVLLTTALGEPEIRAKVEAAVVAEPARAITAFATANTAMQRALAPVIEGMPVDVTLAAAWQLLEDDRSLGATVAKTIAGLAAPVAASARLGGRRSVVANIVSGRALFAAGSAKDALIALTAALASGPEALRALPPPVLASFIRAHTRLIDHLAAWPAALDAARHLLMAGLVDPAAAMLARGLVAQTADTVPQVGKLLAALPADDLATRATLLSLAWRTASEGLVARRKVRAGYFAVELSRVRQAVDDLRSVLTDPLADFNQGPSASQLAAAAATDVGRLMAQLVAFQPVCPVPTEPRQLMLAVVLAMREELAGNGLEIITGSPPAETALPLQLDGALVRGMLSGMLRNLAVAAGSQAAAVTLSVHTQSGDAQAKQALYQLKIEMVDAQLAVGDALRTGTMPDIMRRCRATAQLTAGTDPTVVTLVFAVPELPPPGPQPTPAALAEMHSSLVERAQLSSVATEDLATDAVRLFDGLVQSEIEQWGRDLGLVLHDLKNSLAFVQGWLHGESVWDAETVRIRCQENIEDLQFWLGEAGAIVEREGDGGPAQYVDLRELALRVLRGLAAQMASRKQRLVVNAAERLPTIVASPAAVASVLRNLARNAIYAMPEGSELRVDITHDEQEGQVRVELRDQGPGFAPEVLASSHTAEPADGINSPHLGLASVRRLLADQGGVLYLANDVEGGGGVAIAAFSTGSPGLAATERDVPGWGTVQAEARRAVRAARALAASGDNRTARHLWSAALGLETNLLLAGVAAHALLPRLAKLATGSSNRPQLTVVARTSLIGAFGERSWPRAEAAARRVLARVAQRRLEPSGLDPTEVAVLIRLFDIINDKALATRVVTGLFAVGAELEQEGPGLAGLEARVIDALALVAQARARIAEDV